MSESVVVLTWWQDESGFFAVNNELRYSTGGATCEHMLDHIEESAEAEGWAGYRLVRSADAWPPSKEDLELLRQTNPGLFRLTLDILERGQRDTP